MSDFFNLTPAERKRQEAVVVDEKQVVGVQADPFICQICLNVVSLHSRLTKCSHWFCKGCLNEWIEKKLAVGATPSCPSCQTDLDPKEVQDVANCQVVFKQLKTLTLACCNANRVSGGCCDWTGTYMDYYNHIFKCQLTPEYAAKEKKRQEEEAAAKAAAAAASSPPVPANTQIVTHAISAFGADSMEDGNPITIAEGDTIIVNQQHASGWTHGQNRTNGTVGWFPRYVLPKDLPDPEPIVPTAPETTATANASAAKPREAEAEDQAAEASVITSDARFPYIVRVIQQFEKVDEGSQLTVKQGDIIEIIESSRDGKWVYGCCVQDHINTPPGQAGWFPSWVLQGNRSTLHLSGQAY